MKFISKSLIKKIGLVLLGLGVLGGSAVGVTKLVEHLKTDKESIHPTFEIGGLNAQGRYEEDKTSLYTKDKFACEGLQATLEFDSQITYQVFYYDILDNYISSTEVLTEGHNAAVPFLGAYARIEITPTNDDNDKISFTEKLKYANQLNLKVSKKAEQNVHQNFINVNGNLFKAVDNVSDSLFEFGYKWYEDGNFGEYTDYAATTKSLLRVDGGEKITFDLEGSGLTSGSLTIYEYAESPSVSLKTTKKICNGDNGYTVSLEKSTKYILMVVWSENESLETVTASLTKFIELKK